MTELTGPPLVSIGMPLYNNARTIERALGSLLAQRVASLEIIASDDGSRDGTVEIVERMAAVDPRIRLVRQPRNLNYGNFRYVLDQARGTYFMFAAGDDWWEPSFVERCRDLLDASPAAVCATSRTMMHPESEEPYASAATGPLTGSVIARLVTYLRNPSDNSRMYGLYRTQDARASFPRTDFFAYDWAFCARTLLLGEYVEVPEVLFHREVTPHRRYFEYAKRDGPSAIARLFPLLGMTRHLLAIDSFPRAPAVLRELTWINGYMHAEYVTTHYPRADSTYGRLLRAVLARTESRTDAAR